MSTIKFKIEFFLKFDEAIPEIESEVNKKLRIAYNDSCLDVGWEEEYHTDDSPFNLFSYSEGVNEICVLTIYAVGSERDFLENYEPWSYDVKIFNKAKRRIVEQLPWIVNSKLFIRRTEV